LVPDLGCHCREQNRGKQPFVEPRTRRFSSTVGLRRKRMVRATLHSQLLCALR